MIPCFGVGLDSGFGSVFGSVFGSFFGFFFGSSASSGCFGPFCFRHTANIHVTVTVAPMPPAKNETMAHVIVNNTPDAGFIVEVVECVAGDVGGVIGDVGGDVAGDVGGDVTGAADVRVADDVGRLADGGKVVVLDVVDGGGVGRVLIVVEVVSV